MQLLRGRCAALRLEGPCLSQLSPIAETGVAFSSQDLEFSKLNLSAGMGKVIAIQRTVEAEGGRVTS